MKAQPVSEVYGEVRRDRLYYNLKDFIQPDNELVKKIADKLLNDLNPIAAAQDFVYRNVRYSRERGELWRYPEELLTQRNIVGDCDDKSILLTSILRVFTSPDKVFMVVGELYDNGGSSGHTWVMHDGRILESTACSTFKPKESKYFAQVLFNDHKAYAIDVTEFGYIIINNGYNIRVGR